MSYKATDVPEDLNFMHGIDGMGVLVETTHARDLLPKHISDKLTWPDIKYIGGIRVRHFFGNYEIKPRYLVNLIRGL